MEAPVIKTVGVTKTYRVSAGAFKGKRPLHAVNGVSISVDKGSGAARLLQVVGFGRHEIQGGVDGSVLSCA